MRKIGTVVLGLLLCSSAWADGLPRSGSKVAAPAQPVWERPAALLEPTKDTDWTGFYVGYAGAIGPWARDGNSWDAGGQLGYQLHWQSGLVLGLEVAAAKTWFKELGDYSDSREIEWSGSVRGRVGWATGKTLFYGTGGVGLQSIVDRQEVEEGLVRDRGLAAPWVYGTGVEFRATERVSVKVEWLRYQGEAIELDTRPIDRDTISVGMNYKF